MEREAAEVVVGLEVTERSVAAAGRRRRRRSTGNARRYIGAMGRDEGMKGCPATQRSAIGN